MCGVDEHPLQVYHLTGTHFHPLSQCIKHKKNVNSRNHVFMISCVDEHPLKVDHLTGTHFHPLSQHTKHKKNANSKNRVFIISCAMWMKAL